MSEENCSLCGGTKNVIRLNLFGGSRDEHCTGSFYLCENCAKICKKCDCIIPTDDIKQLLESWKKEANWEEIGSLDLCECEQQKTARERLEKSRSNYREYHKKNWFKIFIEKVYNIFRNIVCLLAIMCQMWLFTPLLLPYENYKMENITIFAIFFVCEFILKCFKSESILSIILELFYKHRKEKEEKEKGGKI